MRKIPNPFRSRSFLLSALLAVGLSTVEAQINFGPNNSIGAGPYSSIGAGDGNVNSSDYSIIAGGIFNTLNSAAGYSLIGAGDGNIITSEYSAIGAGYFNLLPSGSDASFVGGGYQN